MTLSKHKTGVKPQDDFQLEKKDMPAMRTTKERERPTTHHINEWIHHETARRDMVS